MAFSHGWLQEGLWTWLLGLPHIMVVGFQEGAFQAAMAEAVDPCLTVTQYHYCHILLVKQVTEPALISVEGK